MNELYQIVILLVGSYLFALSILLKSRSYVFAASVISIEVILSVAGVSIFWWQQGFRLTRLSKTAAMITFAIFLCLQLFLLFISMVWIIKHLDKIAQELDSLTAGTSGYKRKKKGIKEFGKILLSIERLERAQEEKRYENIQKLKSIERFLPRDVEKILHKGSMDSILAGDQTELWGTLGAISLAQKIEPDSLEQPLLARLNQYIESIEYYNEKYDGILLPWTQDVSVMQVLYQNSVDQAVSFGIDLLRNHKVAEPMLLLHTTNVIYGVVGSHKQVFPVLFSTEWKQISAYTEQFQKAKVLMVLTKASYDLVSHSLQVRKIGYITPALQEPIELYEVLDVYSDEVRQKRMESKERFQKALKLFYQNDFYLARNMFLEVLKKCSDDGISRWYLFTCEHFLNDTDSIDYNLFCR